MKRVFKIVLVFLFTMCIFGCEDNSKKETKVNKTDAVKFKEEYEELNGSRNDSGKVIRVVSIPEDNPIVYSTAEEISKMIDDKESFYVYFGFSKCPWCRSMIEQMFKAASAKNVDKIYYVDVLDIRDVLELNDDGSVKTKTEGDKNYMKLIEQLGDVLSDYTLNDSEGNEVKTGEKRIYAPNIIAVKDGKAEQLEEGTADGLEDPYSELSDEMINNSYEKLECIFKCLEDKVCTKNAC